MLPYCDDYHTRNTNGIEFISIFIQTEVKALESDKLKEDHFYDFSRLSSDNSTKHLYSASPCALA